MERTCVICGAGIGHRHYNAKTCSGSCADKRMREIKREWTRRWRADNSEIEKENRKRQRKKRRQSEPDKVREADKRNYRRRYDANPEPFLSRARRWAAENPEKRRAICAAYTEKRNAALKLIRELEAKGMEALL